VAALARRCRLTLIQPDRWPWYAGEVPVTIRGATVIRLPILLSGKHHFHFYQSGLGTAIRDSRPDLFYFDQEPWSLSTQ
jgi:hypothetical protein